ncbi:MAG: hypothetical protein ACRDWY_09145 [Actinomycetes bacterium]
MTVDLSMLLTVVIGFVTVNLRDPVADIGARITRLEDRLSGSTG